MLSTDDYRIADGSHSSEVGASGASGCELAHSVDPLQSAEFPGTTKLTFVIRTIDLGDGSGSERRYHEIGYDLNGACTAAGTPGAFGIRCVARMVEASAVRYAP